MIVSYVVVFLYRTVFCMGQHFFYGTIIVLYGTKLVCMGEMFCLGQ